MKVIDIKSKFLAICHNFIKTESILLTGSQWYFIIIIIILIKLLQWNLY